MLKIFCTSSSFLFFLAAVVMSCTSEQKKEDEVQTLIFDYDRIEHGQWDDLIVSTRIVHLQVTDSSLISKISKVKYYNQKLFIFDIRQQVIFVFDDLGNFLHRFDIGPGAEEEIKSIYDFDIYDDRIYLLDYRYIKFYALNGEYVGKINIPLVADEYDRASSFIVASNDTFYLWVRNDALGNPPKAEKSRLWRLSLNGKVQDLGIRSLYTGISLGNIFGYSPSCGTLVPFADKNEIYYLNKGQVTKKFILDFGGFDITKKQNLLSSIYSDFQLYKLFTSGENDICGMSYNFIETENFYFFSTMCHSKLRYNFIFKNSNEPVYFELASRFNKGVYPYWVHDIMDNQIVSHMMPINVIELLESYEKGELDHLSKTQKKLIWSLQDYNNVDNPIIVLSRLRKSS